MIWKDILKRRKDEYDGSDVWNYGEVDGWGKFSPIGLNQGRTPNAPKMKETSLRNQKGLKECERCGQMEHENEMVEDSFCRKCAKELLEEE